MIINIKKDIAISQKLLVVTSGAKQFNISLEWKKESLLDRIKRLI